MNPLNVSHCETLKVLKLSRRGNWCEALPHGRPQQQQQQWQGLAPLPLSAQL